MIGKLLKILVTIVVLVVLLAAGLLFLAPASWLKAGVERLAPLALGRELRIEGAFALRRWPPLALVAEDVRLANPAWAEAPEMARIGRLELDWDGLALFEGRILLARLRLVEPTLWLERDASGRANWTFAAGEEERRRGPEADEGQGAPPLELVVGRVEIENGRVMLRDRERGIARDFSDIRLEVAPAEEPGFYTIAAEATAGGEKAAIEGRLVDPRELLRGARGPVDLSLRMPGGGLSWSGVVAYGEEIGIDGTLDVALDEPRALFDWLGITVALPQRALRTVVLRSRIAGAPDALRFEDLEAAIDDIRGQGALELARTGIRPKLSGRLELSQLDLDPYFPAAEEQPQPEQAPAPEEAAGWPEEPLPPVPMLPFDLDLELRFAGVKARGVVLGEGEARIAAADGRAELTVRRLALYDGNLRGRLQLATSSAPDLALALEAERLQLLPLLEAFADLGVLEGRGDVAADLTAQGSSVAELVRSLSGELRFVARDGAINGVNIAATLRQILTLGAEGAGAPKRTDFAELSASYEIEQGVARNDDLWLAAPLLRVRGSGVVDLPQRRIRYRLEPEIASTLEGQQASGEPVFQAGVPIVVEGPWAEPDWRFEIGGRLTEAIGDPGQLGDLLAKLEQDPAMLRSLLGTAGRLVPEGVRGLVPLPGLAPEPTPPVEAPELPAAGVPKQLLPGGEGGAQGEADERPPEPVRRLLKGLIGR